MVQSMSPTRLDRDYQGERSGYNGSQSFSNEGEVLINDKFENKSKYTKALVVSSALLFGAAVIFTVSAISFGNSSLATPLTSEAESTSKFDSKGRSNL